MLIRWHTDYALTSEGKSVRHPAPEWPESWPVPRIGDEVELADGFTAKVEHVIWYPHGEFGDQDEPARPFVYVVLH